MNNDASPQGDRADASCMIDQQIRRLEHQVKCLRALKAALPKIDDPDFEPAVWQFVMNQR